MNVEKSIKSSLEKLRLDYIDLFLLHGPTPVKEENGKYVPDLVPHIGTWHVLEKYYKAGTFKAIGLSNFTIPQMEDLIKKAEIKPHNLQVECHACFPQYELHEFCKKMISLLHLLQPWDHQQEISMIQRQIGEMQVQWNCKLLKSLQKSMVNHLDKLCSVK
uniref:NADP-dependent oxidoreductase domain-containing protein n=1 Tax=Panagrolaimus superbus TaxID=310955 RepID=A0A914YWU9_9BILA